MGHVSRGGLSSQTWTDARAAYLDNLSGGSLGFFKHYQLAFVESSPTQNVFATALDTTDFRILAVAMDQRNDEVAAKNLEAQITLDTEVWNMTAVAVNNDTLKFLWMDVYDSVLQNTNSEISFGAGGGDVAAHCQAGKFEVKTTSALGTNQDVGMLIIYEKWEDT